MDVLGNGIPECGGRDTEGPSTKQFKLVPQKYIGARPRSPECDDKMNLVLNM